MTRTETILSQKNCKVIWKLPFFTFYHLCNTLFIRIQDTLWFFEVRTYPLIVIHSFGLEASPL